MRLRLTFTVLLISLLSACGFHLRGDSQIAEGFNPVFVIEEQLDATQLKLIRSELKRSSAILAASAQDANRLRVVLSPLKRRKIAVSSLTDVELVRLTMSIQFSVKAESGVYLMQQQQIVQSVEVELDNANLLANDQTIKRAQQGLMRKLIQNMIFSLSH